MEHDILYEQIAYYRARAEEYDESIYQVGCYASPGGSNEDLGELEVTLHTLRTLGPVEHILELACGTGIWTKELLKIRHTVRTLTAIDASPEMLQIEVGLGSLQKSITGQFAIFRHALWGRNSAAVISRKAAKVTLILIRVSFDLIHGGLEVGLEFLQKSETT